jgi:hypothetical protein
MRWLLLLPLLPACGSLVDGDYPGEPLVRLHGVPGLGPTFDTTPGAKAAALWQSDRPEGTVEFTRLPLEIDFPAFWIAILAPPRDDAMLQIDPSEPAFAEGYLHIIKGDSGAQATPEAFLATDYEHVLLYLTDATPPGGLTARYLGAALGPGFHVATRSEVTLLSAPQQALVDQCVAAAGSLSPARAAATCTAQHLYQLAPAPDDLDTLLEFRVERSGT